jgi:hypothetical protein
MPPRSLITKNEAIVQAFSARMQEWEIKFFATRAATASASKANINQWLNDMELNWDGGMVQANMLSGFGSSSLVRNTANLGYSFAAFQEIYSN